MKENREDNVSERKLYFEQVLEKISTEFWCNNPTNREVDFALKNGAIGITTNPGYYKVLLEQEKEFLDSTIKEVIKDKKQEIEDLDNYCFELLKKLISKLLKIIYPLYKNSLGRFGYVAVQGNPLKNNNTDEILKEAESFKKLGENVIIKVPSTAEGADALKVLTEEGYSTICTMSFTVSQYILMAEKFQESSKKVKTRKGIVPKCYITMLPGILNEYLLNYSKKAGIKDISDIEIKAGCLYTAKAAYKVFKSNRYEAKILAGGARTEEDWTGIVGKNTAATIGWKLAEKIIGSSPKIIAKIDEPADTDVIERLKERFPDFKRAVDTETKLGFADIREYGPFVFMQNNFIKSQNLLIEKIKSSLNTW